MYFYTAYGLTVQSEIEIPELIPTKDTQSDVTIRIAQIPRPEGELGWNEFDFHASNDEVYFHWEVVGSFLVSNGTEIAIDPKDNVDGTLLRTPLLGMVFAMLLHQRGFLVLHGSAIDIGGNAVAFLGDKGMGKSTLAATLHSRGHRLITDDVVVVDMRAGCPGLYSAFPQFKLWPDAIDALGKDLASWPKIAEEYEKRISRVDDDGFSSESVPLKNIYVLGRGEEIAIEKLGHQNSIIELVKNSHATRLGRFLPSEDQKRNFIQSSQLANSADVYHFRRPYALALLSEVSQALEEHIGFAPVPA